MNEHKIHDAIDKIEPQNGAREQMYQNIMSKAAHEKSANNQAGVQKVRTMKPVRLVRIAASAAACLCVIVLAVMKFIPSDSVLPSSDCETMLGDYASSYVTVESANDFKALGITIDAPDGAENVGYAIIDQSIASMDFSLDGHDFSVRASEQAGDFSGISGSILSSEQLDSRSNAILYSVDCDTNVFWKVCWTDGKINYFLSCMSDASSDEVKDVSLSLIEQTLE